MDAQVRRCAGCGALIPLRTGRAAHLCRTCRHQAELDAVADAMEARRAAVLTVQELARQAAHRGVSGGIALTRQPWVNPNPPKRPPHRPGGARTLA